VLRAGVIGWPVSHSLSPKLHTYWLEKYSIEGEYAGYEVEPNDLESFLFGLADRGMRGCNLTLPHKEAALSLVTTLDDSARLIGAVNTIVVQKDGSLKGSNTDAYGFSENIKPYLKGKQKAVMLGAGGAARAVLYALKTMGFEEIVVVNRTFERAERLVQGLGRGMVVELWENRSEILRSADLLVNCTSLGLKNSPPLTLDLALLPMYAVVTDIVYNPLITPLLADAKAKNYQIVDGLGMLLHQAVPGFEAWFGRKPEVTQELREHLLS
jgi:shikimate dehydrogenase